MSQKYRILHCYGLHLSFEFGEIELITFGDFASQTEFLAILTCFFALVSAFFQAKALRKYRLLRSYKFHLSFKFHAIPLVTV